MPFHARARCGAAVLLLLAGCAVSADPRVAWRAAESAWDQRAPGAWAAWRAIPASSAEGAEATRRLREAGARYEEGIALLERDDPRATDAMRDGARIAPIDPELYLRLARARRSHGANDRAAGFYRKYLETSPEHRAEIERELAALDMQSEDPFSPAQGARPLDWLLATVPALCALVLLVLWSLPRLRPVRLARLLEEHPERAASFGYLAGILRHELIKHRLAPLRAGAQPARASAEPIEIGWRRHVDTIGAALGLPRGWVRREPSFRAVDRALMRLARASEGAASEPLVERSLRALARLDQALVSWSRATRRTALDDALCTRLLQSLADERPGGELGVAIDYTLAAEPLQAVILEDDLLLVLRNLLRNAIAVAAATPVRAVHLDTRAVIDVTGAEWVRISVHDPSARRLGPSAAADRGLGIVRETLERYGGALLEEAPAEGFEKALTVSLPRAELDEPVAAQASARAAA